MLVLRYGLDGRHPRTLDEVGRAFSVTRERIRQIENQSLKKLRSFATLRRCATSHNFRTKSFGLRAGGRRPSKVAASVGVASSAA